jgi:hypothetical protein
VFASIGAALVVLAAAARLLRVEEFEEAWQRISRRIFPRRAS